MDSKDEKTPVTTVTSKETQSAIFWDPKQESVWTRVGLTPESFKRAPATANKQMVAGNADHDVEADSPRLQPKMKKRHLNMIAVGGSIGTGLFVSSGSALHNGGPAALIIAWSIIGLMLINVTQALGEMCIMYPVSGGFYTLSARFLDPSFAFAMGWNYVFQWLVTLPLEITVAVTTVNYWPNSVPTAAWITIFWLLITIISLFGTLGFAEEEFWSSCLKLLVVIIFIFVGIICAAGGGPSSGEFGTYLGGKNWSDPGAFANGFKGVCAVFVTAAFSFSGTELIGLAASETPDPRGTMPGAVKGTFWRVTIIYITTMTIIGILVPWNNEKLIGGSGSSASPFVIALDLANISGLNHLVNVTICISVLSIGLSCVYAGSRTLTALAEQHYAPRFFTYVDKSSRPLASLGICLIFGAIAYVNCAPGATGDNVFNWLLALSGLSTLFTWLSICLCHIRFRAAWIAQGHSLEELPYQALGGVYGSWLGVILIVLVLIAQFYVAIWPLGDPVHGLEAADSFFKAYLAVPVMISFWIGGYLWKRVYPKRASDIDLDSGRRSWLTVEDMRAYRAERALAPGHVKLYRLLFSN
ncbi:APC amino acid permease [Cylindrobasidium torrendii FP15055 ss-10]|uniref:APC amino acid permease n=1 Tax=Cylindrobasidium torrendii FP15055 ss-10 TaxID=1314674 RepID=A0A0D7BPC3_9AGAR|nr:APC amino acid permease [Cylindrobasidium torrendii FP15055 ss-10]